jgi:FtsP/CotA-like multicopper oxidase with cupredoxin domain
VLRSFGPELGANFFENRFAGGDASFDLLQLRAASTQTPSPQLPPRLLPHGPLREEVAMRTRRFELGGTSINGKEMDLTRIDAVVEIGTTEAWGGAKRLEHAAQLPPPRRHVPRPRPRGHTPPPYLRGPKDTVYLPPGKSVRLLLRFGAYADPHLPYVFHCHILQHEDRGMMGQVVVVQPGQTAGRLRHDNFAHEQSSS